VLVIVLIRFRSGLFCGFSQLFHATDFRPSLEGLFGRVRSNLFIFTRNVALG